MTERPRLATKPGCPFAERTRIVLAMLDLARDVVVIDIDDKPGWFRALSPFGKVPVLIDGMEAFFESTAIGEYLVERFSAGSGLVPDDAASRARMRAWVQFDETALTPAFYRLVLASDPDRQAHERATYFARRQVLEDRLAADTGPFLLGARPTLADVTLYPHLARTPVLVEHRGAAPAPSGSPLARWLAAMAALDAVAAAATPIGAMRLDLAPYLDASARGTTKADTTG